MITRVPGCSTITATTGESWLTLMWRHLDNRDRNVRSSHSNLRIVRFSIPNRTCTHLTYHHSGIETQFTIAAALKLASLHYHEWLPNETFASSEFADENLWMTSVLRRLDTKWERKKLIWENRPWAEPSEYKKLARVHVPSVLFLTQAFYLRQLETGCAGPLKRRDT